MLHWLEGEWAGFFGLAWGQMLKLRCGGPDQTLSDLDGPSLEVCGMDELPMI